MSTIFIRDRDIVNSMVFLTIKAGLLEVSSGDKTLVKAGPHRDLQPLAAVLLNLQAKGVILSGSSTLDFSKEEGWPTDSARTDLGKAMERVKELRRQYELKHPETVASADWPEPTLTKHGMNWVTGGKSLIFDTIELAQAHGPTTAMVQVGNGSYRWRRKKLVLIPVKWLGKIPNAQTMRKRKKKK